MQRAQTSISVDVHFGCLLCRGPLIKAITLMGIICALFSLSREKKGHEKNMQPFDQRPSLFLSTPIWFKRVDCCVILWLWKAVENSTGRYSVYCCVAISREAKKVERVEFFTRLLPFLGAASLNAKMNGMIALRTIVYFLVTSLISALIGLALVLIIHPGDPDTKNELGDGNTEDRKIDIVDNFLDLGRNLFPDNLFQASFMTAHTKYEGNGDDAKATLAYRFVFFNRLESRPYFLFFQIRHQHPWNHFLLLDFWNSSWIPRKTWQSRYRLLSNHWWSHFEDGLRNHVVRLSNNSQLMFRKKWRYMLSFKKTTKNTLNTLKYRRCFFAVATYAKKLTKHDTFFSSVTFFVKLK